MTSSAVRHRIRAPERGHPAAERQRHDTRGQPIPHFGFRGRGRVRLRARNTFGIAFDPVSGALWDQQNADDAFDEMNLVERGMNGAGSMGPVGRIQQFKQIETTLPPSGGLPGATLQQIRWPATNIADSPQRRSRACTSCRDRTTAIRSSAGASRRPQRGSASSPAALSARSIRTTCSRERRRR